MTNSFQHRTSFSGAKPNGLMQSMANVKDQKSNLKKSIIPSSELFIAMSQGNESSINSSSEDETFKEDPLFEKIGVSDSHSSNPYIVEWEEFS